MKPTSLFYIITGILGIGSMTTQTTTVSENQIKNEVVFQQDELDNQETEMFVIH